MTQATRLPVVIAGLALGAGLSVLFLDRPIATAMHEIFHGHPVLIALTRPADAILPLADLVLVWFGGLALSGRRPGPVGMVLLMAAITALVAATLCEELKIAFGRLWPETWVADNPSWIRDGAYGFEPFHGGRGWASFPSGHANLIAAPILVMIRAWGRRAWPLAGLIALVAIGLVGANHHYLGDVIAGIAVALVSTLAVEALVALSVMRADRPPASGLGGTG